MPRLEDLRKNLLDMSPDELRQRIKQIREDRILRKVAPKTKVAKVKKANTLRTALDGMTPEQLAELLKDMEA